MKYYAGIGSRNTPDDILKMMSEVAYFLAMDGFILRSGGADGADIAFQKGVELYNKDFGFKDIDNMDIFLPKPFFNGSKFPFREISREAYDYFYRYHPYGQNIKNDFTKRLMGRNTYQVLGYELKNFSKFVLCWTPNGCITHDQRIEDVKKTGGTGQAISIAHCHGIKVYNLARPEHKARIEKYLIKKRNDFKSVIKPSIKKARL